MRVLFIAAEMPYPDDSGGKKYSWQKIRQLSRENEVILVAINEFNDIVRADVLRKYVKEYYFFPRVKSAVKIVSNFYRPFTIVSRESKCIKNKILEIISNSNIDFIILDSIHMYGSIDKVNTGLIPVFLTQHNIEHELFNTISKNTSNIIKKIIYKFESIKLKRLEKKLYSQGVFNGYIFISDIEYKRHEETIGKVNGVCIPPCIEEDSNGFQKKIENNAIVFIGKMNFEPNVTAMEWFIKAIFPNILKKIPESKLYVVGKNPTKELLGFSSDNVIITGAVEDVKEYLSKAQIIVIPLLSGAGVKLKLFEALETNNIVITTKLGVEGTCFKDNEDLFITDNAELFAKICIDNLIQPNYEVAKNGNKTLRDNYGFEAIGNKLNKFLNSNFEYGREPVSTGQSHESHDNPSN